jgi:hypothetical protein
MPRKKEIPFQRYPHIPLLTSNAKLRRMLLGKRLLWTIKEDGENVTIWLKKQYRKKMDIIISSHNQEVASPEIAQRTKSTEDFPKILKLIETNPTFRVIVEECRKGQSVTGIKTYPRAILYVVDIFDTSIMNFLPYSLVYQYCYHTGIPVVSLFAETRHRTMKDLLKYKNHILEHCDAVKEEGMVVKTFNEDGEYIQAKVKLDTPEPKERKVREGQVILPQIPENEIWGAISKVEADYGLTGNPKDDLPLIAKYVNQACKEHLYSKPRGKLYDYWKDYLGRMKHKT